MLYSTKAKDALSRETGGPASMDQSSLDPFNLDDLDRGIIDALRADPRSTNRKIAQALGSSEATIATRIRRMSELGAMRVVAETDMRAFGYDMIIVVSVTVRDRTVDAVAADLAEIEEAVSVVAVFGKADLMMTVLARSSDHLLDILENRIARVQGVDTIESMMMLEALAYPADWGVLT